MKTVKQIAVMLGRNRVTVQKWLKKYRNGGLDRLLEEKIKSTGRPTIISSEVNPIERFWKEVKKILKNKVFDRLDFLRKKLANILAEFQQTDITSITGYGFILEARSVAGL